MVSLIIGNGGVQIRRLQRISGARVLIDEDSHGSNETNISIIGKKKAIRRAKGMIFDICYARGGIVLGGDRFNNHEGGYDWGRNAAYGEPDRQIGEPMQFFGSVIIDYPHAPIYTLRDPVF